jgi:hypothetical protein
VVGTPHTWSRSSPGAPLESTTDAIRLRRYLDVLGENTAGLPTDTTLVEAGLTPAVPIAALWS